MSAQQPEQAQIAQMRSELPNGWDEAEIAVPSPALHPGASKELSLINDLFSSCCCSGVAGLGEWRITARAAAAIIIIWQ